MVRPIRSLLLLGGLLWVAGDCTAYAGILFHRHEEGTPKPGHARYFERSAAAAGWPLLLNGHARPTYTSEYVAQYVGGGSGCCTGGPRRIEEGTWGLDYRGCLIPRHVLLNWSHGRCYEGGTGAYEPNGPFVPDVIGLTITNIENLHH